MTENIFKNTIISQKPSIDIKQPNDIFLSNHNNDVTEV